MVEIIRAGRLPQNDWYDHHCMNCRTHFKFQKKEVNSSYDQRDGENHSIKCPFCKNTCYIYKLSRYNPPTVDPY